MKWHKYLSSEIYAHSEKHDWFMKCLWSIHASWMVSVFHEAYVPLTSIKHVCCCFAVCQWSWLKGADLHTTRTTRNNAQHAFITDNYMHTHTHTHTQVHNINLTNSQHLHEKKQHTTYNIHTYNTQHITHNTQHTTHNTQHTTHNTQHTTHNTQHTTHHNTQHTTHNTQHTNNPKPHKS